LGSSNINFFSEALDWTFKLSRYFSKDFSMEFKTHAGWTIFGASDLYIYSDIGEIENIYRDYGTGGNAKLFFSLIHKKAGKLSLSALLYRIYIISHEIAESRGFESAYFFNVSYNYFFSKTVAIGMGNSFSKKDGDYSKIPTAEQWTSSLKVYIEWLYSASDRKKSAAKIAKK
jgi:hypothetical protein